MVKKFVFTPLYIANAVAALSGTIAFVLYVLDRP